MARDTSTAVAFRRILVAIDLDDASKHALELGRELAERLGAALVAVHVWELPPYPYASMATSMVHRSIERATREAFDAFLAEAREKTPGITGVLKEGTPWREIVQFAEQEKADLLVVGTHGRHGIPRVLLGSVAEKVVRMSSVPVLAVPAQPDAGDSTAVER